VVVSLKDRIGAGYQGRDGKEGSTREPGGRKLGEVVISWQSGKETSRAARAGGPGEESLALHPAS
jgi:hypothetical protein